MMRELFLNPTLQMGKLKFIKAEQRAGIYMASQSRPQYKQTDDPQLQSLWIKLSSQRSESIHLTRYTYCMRVFQELVII